MGLLSLERCHLDFFFFMNLKEIIRILLLSNPALHCHTCLKLVSDISILTCSTSVTWLDTQRQYGSLRVIIATDTPQVIGRDETVKQRSGWYPPEGIDVTKLNLTVKCAECDTTLPRCNNVTSPCLYNISEDPCEYNNIASQYPPVVDELMAELMHFASQAQPPRNCPNYKWADPVYHGGAWTPYIKLNDTKHDRLC